MTKKSRSLTFVLSGPLFFLVLSLALYATLQINIAGGARYENSNYSDCLAILSILFLPLTWIIGMDSFSGIFAIATSWLICIGVIFTFHLLPYFDKRDGAAATVGTLTYFGLSLAANISLISLNGGL